MTVRNDKKLLNDLTGKDGDIEWLALDLRVLYATWFESIECSIGSHYNRFEESREHARILLNNIDERRRIEAIKDLEWFFGCDEG